MARHNLMRVEPLIAKFRLPKQARIVGYLKYRDGTDNFEYPIVRQNFRVVTKVPDIDPRTGEQAWKLSPRGERITLKFKLERKTVTRDWVPAYSPQGHIARNFDFRPDPAEMKRAESQERAKRTMQELASALAAENMSVEQMMARLRGPKKAAPIQEPTEEPTEELVEEPELEPEQIDQEPVAVKPVKKPAATPRRRYRRRKGKAEA